MATYTQRQFRDCKEKWDKDPARELNGEVRRIKSPKRKEPAEPCTIATIILRRNKDLYLGHKSADPDLRFLSEMYYDCQERALTDKESKRVLALITWLRGRQ